jgi:transcriptional regulator with XRE-family HTH domain
MKGITERIKSLRNESGKTDIEVADFLKLSIYEYGDLESYDKDIIDVVSVKTAVQLAGLYNQSLLQLLVPEKERWPKEHLSETQLAEKAKALMAQKGLSQEEAEDQVGWFLEGFLANPRAYVEENPIMFLQDLSRFLGVNWLCSVSNVVNS